MGISSYIDIAGDGDEQMGIPATFRYLEAFGDESFKPNSLLVEESYNFFH
jgi:hypothetical protein